MKRDDSFLYARAEERDLVFSSIFGNSNLVQALRRSEADRKKFRRNNLTVRDIESLDDGIQGRCEGCPVCQAGQNNAQGFDAGRTHGMGEIQQTESESIPSTRCI